jgi:hypothetical protein
MLMKLTPGLTFINIHSAAFTLVDTKREKKLQLSHKYLFTLWGSTGAKANRRTLMKLTLGRGEGEGQKYSEEVIFHNN